MERLAGHWGDLLVVGILLAVVTPIVVRMVRDRRAGGCGCGCSGCPHRDGCEKKEEPRR